MAWKLTHTTTHGSTHSIAHTHGRFDVFVEVRGGILVALINKLVPAGQRTGWVWMVTRVATITTVAMLLRVAMPPDNSRDKSINSIISSNYVI